MGKETFYNYNSSSPVQVTRELYSNVGNGDNFVGDYPRAVKSSIDFEIWDSVSGGNQLAEGVDYELRNQDKVLTAKSGFDVYAGYKILNVTYQTGNIYITYKVVQSYNDADIQNDLRSELTTIQGQLGGTKYLTSADSPYTVLDGDGFTNYSIDSSGGNVSITLLDLATNQEIVKKFIHQIGGNLLTINSAGSDTIDGLTSVELPKQYNFLEILGTTSTWAIISENISCQLFLHTSGGGGSTDTAIEKFTVSVEDYGNMFTHNHGSYGTAGLEITIVRSGKYSILACTNNSIAVNGGLSLNSSQLTTDIHLITPSDRICIGTTFAISQSIALPITRWFDVGDIIRPHHTNIPGAGTDDRCNFTATYVGS